MQESKRFEKVFEKGALKQFCGYSLPFKTLSKGIGICYDSICSFCIYIWFMLHSTSFKPLWSNSCFNDISFQDLSSLNRDLSKVIMVDCNAKSYQLQPKNALGLKKWEGNDDDRTLFELAAFLRSKFLRLRCNTIFIKPCYASLVSKSTGVNPWAVCIHLGGCGIVQWMDHPPPPQWMEMFSDLRLRPKRHVKIHGSFIPTRLG